jgi:hypothetical protein
MKILFLHGLESLPGGSKVEYLRGLGHTVLNPLLPKADFDESVRIAQEEVDLEDPELIIGSSRGGAVAMAIDPGKARLILIAPAWKHFEVPPSAPAGTDVLHCTNDTTVLYQDSQKLQGANLVPCGDDHRMADEDALAALGRAVGGNLKNENLIRKYIRTLLTEKNVLATGMCFPFAYQKAEEWFKQHYTPPADPDSYGKKHPDLNDKSKFKVVHGTVTNKWKKPPKPVVHGWVEMGNLVFDDQTKVTKPNGIDKEVYYDMYQPEVYKEFTAEEAVVNCVMKGGEGPWDDDLYAMMQDRDAWLQEKTQRGKGKKKRILYHINRHRPAKPQPKMSYMLDWEPDKIGRDGKEGDFVNVPGTDNWQRHWLDSPVKSGVFLTPNPLDIAMNHGRSGHVYAYRVPEWVIAKSGGLHRYDTGSEVLIPEDVWNEAGKEIEFLGKSMSKEQMWDKMDSSQFGRGHHRKAKKPSWMSDEELKQWQSGQGKFNLSGLRATRDPEGVIKLLTAEEQKKAIAAIEAKKEYEEPRQIEKGPRDKKGIVVPPFSWGLDKKDEELLDLLKRHMNESVIRNIYTWRDTGGSEKVTILSRYIREIIRENTYQSHTHEPEVGQMVVNVNPKCKHFGSEGIVLEILSLPGDAGKTIQYQCINDGETWSEGDILEKTMDQLAPIGG